jgi:predicted metal-dependent hydrolase
MPWIKKQRAKFAKQERQTEREYVSGESHYFMGKRYLLNVIYQNTPPKLEIKRKNRIDLYVRFGTKVEKREEILENFYRHELKNQIKLLLTKWQKRTGIHIDEVKIKKMKTKWGTANQKAHRIWINLELAKKPKHCLEYVLVHELVHFLEKNHSVKFQRLMNTLMPQWKQYREELNCSPLGYNDWKC